MTVYVGAAALAIIVVTVRRTIGMLERVFHRLG